MSITTMVLKRVSELNDGRIGLDDYPIFDEGYRDTLNTKIFDRYMNREIGQETDSMFIHVLGRRMREIMPYYNQLYESEKLVIDPFNNINVATTGTSDTGSNSTTTGEGTSSTDRGTSEEGTSSTDRGTSDEGETTTDTTTNVEGTSSTDVSEDSETSNDSSNSSDSKSRAMGSQTPQVRLSPDADYADSISDSWSENSSTGEATDTRTGTSSETGSTTDETTTNETGTTSNTGTSTETGTTSNTGTETETGSTSDESETNSTTSVADDAHRIGFEGSQVDMLKNLRSSFLNIDLQVLDELEDLFMLTWFNDDYYTDHNSMLYGRVL